MFGLRAPNIDGKPVVNSDSLRVLLTFNIAYDQSIRPLELQRINDAGCYMTICYTGVRPAELVNNERKPPNDGSLEQLFGTNVVTSADANAEFDEEAADEESRKLYVALLRETVKRGRPKALCYEDILMMMVRYPCTGRATLAMSLKFIYHKGCDNKPKPYVALIYRLFCIAYLCILGQYFS